MLRTTVSALRKTSEPVLPTSNQALPTKMVPNLLALAADHRYRCRTLSKPPILFVRSFTTLSLD